MTMVAAILRHNGFQVTSVDPTATIAQVAEVLATRRPGAVLVPTAQHKCWVSSANATSYAASRQTARTRCT